MPGWESKSVAIQGKQGKRTCIYQVKNTVMVSGEMSSGKLPQTPKTVYESSGSSCLRLCKSVGDTSSWKNLSGKGNRALLATAEIIYGSSLIQDKHCPIYCADLAKKIRVLIKESQSSFQRLKRCTEISPSVPRTLPKSPKAKDSENSRCRELCFQPRTDRVNPPQSSSGKEVYKSSLLLIYLSVCVHKPALSHIREM